MHLHHGPQQRTTLGVGGDENVACPGLDLKVINDNNSTSCETSDGIRIGTKLGSMVATFPECTSRTAGKKGD